MISVYIDRNNIEEEEKESTRDDYQTNNKTLIIIILVIIGIISFIDGLTIGSIIYKKKKKKLTANEMKEENLDEKRESLNNIEIEDNKKMLIINS
jgi:flagellar basal body-associated protein FliL